MQVKVELMLEFDDSATETDIRTIIEGPEYRPSMWCGLGPFIDDNMPEYIGLLEGSWVENYIINPIEQNS